MADLSTCDAPTCAFTVEGSLAVCPKCGGPMRAVRESRLRGWALLLLGLLLVGMMGAITFYMAPALMRPGEEADGNSFTGTAQQARLILYLFWALIGFGAVTTANGLYQIATGRQHWAFVALTLLVFASLAILVIVSMQALK
jgi:hypothetical protein